MTSHTLRSLGWKPCFERQVEVAEREAVVPARVAAHLGSRLFCLTAEGSCSPQTPASGDIAVGDWLLLDSESSRVVRRLERASLIARKAAGEVVKSQPIAANLDTLFVVTSCNHDFKLSRLERYLALANDAEVTPVIVLTKADVCDDAASLRQQAARLQTGLIVESVDARDHQQVAVLAAWCGEGQTVALVGSSGVGKSTLAMTLGAGQIATQEIREDDSKGRHTTTVRSMHRLDAGGLLIDTPGMREIQLADCEEGLAEVFDEIIELAHACRFRDCSHQDEPGCAVQAAIESGELDSRRFKNYLKLQSEQARNAQSLHERRHTNRKLGQFYKSVQSSKRRLKDGGGEI